MATTPKLLLTLLENQQNQPEIPVNVAFSALDTYVGGNPLLLFARKNSNTVGFVWGIHGGSMNVDGAIVTVADQTVTLSSATGPNTNYVEATRTGTVSTNTTGFSANRIPLWEVTTTAAGGVTSYIDRRDWIRNPIFSILAKSMGADANFTTLTAAESRANTLHITSSVTLTATRDFTLPLMQWEYEVYNGTTGGRALRFIGSSGTGVTVQNRQRMKIYCDGTNWLPSNSSEVIQDLAYAASITVDASGGDRVVVQSLTGALTMNAPTNPSKGQVMHLCFTQDATGGRVITWNAAFKKAADGAGTANQKSATAFMYDGTDWVQQGGALTWS